MIGVISTDSFRQEEAGQGYVDFHGGNDGSNDGSKARADDSEMDVMTCLFYPESIKGTGPAGEVIKA